MVYTNPYYIYFSAMECADLYTLSCLTNGLTQYKEQKDLQSIDIVLFQPLRGLNINQITVIIAIS